MADFITLQSRSFLVFFLCGLCAAALFDLMRLLRKLLTHNVILTALEDILFWLLTGSVIFILLYRFQSGKLRLFLLFGFLSGICIWLTAFSRLITWTLYRLLLYFIPPKDKD